MPSVKITMTCRQCNRTQTLTVEYPEGHQPPQYISCPRCPSWREVPRPSLFSRLIGLLERWESPAPPPTPLQGALSQTAPAPEAGALTSAPEAGALTPSTQEDKP